MATAEERIVQQLAQEVVNMGAEDGAAALKTENLQKAARIFLEEYKNFEKFLQAFTSFETKRRNFKDQLMAGGSYKGLSKSQMEQKVKTDPLYMPYIQEKEQMLNVNFVSFYSAVHNFQQKLLLAEDIKLVYHFLLWSKKEQRMIVYEVDNPIQLLGEKGYRRGGAYARFKVSLKNIEQLMKSTTGIKKVTIENKYSALVKRVDYIYNVTTRRFDYGKKKKTNRVMWKPQGRWKVFKVSAQGDIDQAYGTVVFTRKGRQQTFAFADFEMAIDRFMEQYVKKVDSASGIFEGDYEGVDGTQFAAKGSGSSFMGYKQIVSIAQGFASGKLTSSILPRLKEALRGKAGTRDSGQEIEDVSQFMIDGCIEQMEQEVLISQKGWQQLPVNVNLI